MTCRPVRVSNHEQSNRSGLPFCRGDVGFSWSTLLGRPSFNGARRVLVIDDNRDTTRLIRVLLESRGDYFVLAENHPAKAHQTAQEFRPDVILLDIVMPDTDGGEVAARIEKDPKLQGTPIIFLTALVTKSEAKSGLEIQGHSFLAKPISIPELVEAIEYHLPTRRKPMTGQ
jgi:CheY-like chemotaxis protein